MRKSSLLFLLLMLTGFAYGETVVGEMLHEGTAWGYAGYWTADSYTIKGTKAMNGKTYGLLNMEHRSYDGARAMGPEDLSWYYATLGIRDEGGKIYVNKEEYLSLLTQENSWSLVGEVEPLPYEETFDGELVLYDFNKNVGDEYCQLADGTSLTVTNVSVLTTEDGISRRRLTLSNGFDLIEGVGCTNSPGFLLYWLNIKPDCKERMRNVGLLTYYGIREEDGSLQRILSRDFDATINEMNGNPNKMLTQGRRWVYNYDNGEMKGTLTYTVEGDTLLHAYKRAKVYMTLTDNETKNVVRSGYIGAFNEISNSLHFLPSDSSEAVPLYDFTQHYQSVFEYSGITRFVVNDDSIMAGNDKLHRIQMLNKRRYDPFPLDKDSLYYWVEGIGSSKGLLEYYAGTLMDSIQFVGCYDGDERFFTKEDFEKEGNQPSKFCNSLRIGPLSYNIELGSKTARVLPSDSYQTMSSINIPSSVELWGIACKVTAINDRAFYDCNAITSVEISEGVVEIGEEAFRKCESITSLSLPSTLVTIKDKGFFGLKSLTSLVLPENLKTIGGWAFQTCLKLKELDIPASVESIGRYAFSHCQSLENVYCRATTLPTTDETRQFRDINPEAVLHVPAASIEAYRSTAPWSNFKYIVPIEDQNNYRPMIEDGKVWKVGSTTGISDGVVKMVEYYYFDGDTIVDGRTCKQMMCQRYVSPDHPDYDDMIQIPSLRNIGAWYEENKKVYFYNAQNIQYRMMYDFSLDTNETFLIDDYYSYVIGPKQTGGLDGFKGVYRDVMWYDEEEPYYNTIWLEGVGGIDGPTVNVYYGKEGHGLFLMSCSVGDEVIYLNDNYEDGASIDAAGARKDRFDFVHIIKPRPKAPSKQEKSDACISSSEREVTQPKVKAPSKQEKMMVKSPSKEAEEPIYGEYNELQLDINLTPLADAYMVSITNESGKAVYEKAINAGSIVGLNIDISAYAKGRYTVTMENSLESFTGEFEVQTTGIEEVIDNNKVKARTDIFNLQGQRISSLQKGLNIVNGRKVVIK